MMWLLSGVSLIYNQLIALKATIKVRLSDKSVSQTYINITFIYENYLKLNILEKCNSINNNVFHPPILHVFSMFRK